MFLKRSEEQERQGSCRTGPGWSWVILCGPGGSRIQGSDRTQVGGVFEMVCGLRKARIMKDWSWLVLGDPV